MCNLLVRELFDKMFMSYPSERKQIVSGGEQNIFRLEVLLGVPQVSVLEPMSVRLYVNEVS